MITILDQTLEELMIGQKCSLEYLVPLALEELERNPLAEGVYYEGDLLEGMSRVPVEFWEQHGDQHERWQSILVVVANLPADVLDDLPFFLLTKLTLL